jgi:hypothetical protein
VEWAAKKKLRAPRRFRSPRGRGKVLPPQFDRGGLLRTIEDMRRGLQLLLFCCLVSTGVYAADPAPPFDLIGPKMDVRVKRGEVTLPIGETPNLLAGDRLWIHPDLPESQSAHYVLIVAFLRGSTNPPPAEWFTRVETWTREAREEGVFITVPAEAQQALIFFAPETGGDFSTLRKAVTNRPGAFVRAVQDLEAASWDRMRLNAFLAEVKETSQADPKSLKGRTEMAARSLGIRLEQQCFDKPSDQQAPCLVQHSDGLVMDDTNAQSRVAQLTSGSSADLMNQLSSSSLGKGGAYSPYVGAIVDTAKIFGQLHTAHFQYIPALALPTKDALELRLNVPPSFRDPKSVVVVALPPVGPARLPSLHPVNAAESFCAQKPGLVLPAEGAPLVFATQLAYGLTLRIETKGGPVELAVKADPSLGGLVLAHPAPPLPEGELTGVLHGKWGFDDWEGPRFHLRAAQPGKWSVAAADQSALVVGREDTLHIEGENALCVDRIACRIGDQTAAATPLKLAWKASLPEQLEVSVPMKDASPGPVTLEIYQFGLEKPDRVPLTAYAEAAALERLTLSEGDAQARLKGSRLDEVAKVSLGSITWTPAALSRVQEFDQLELNTGSSTAALKPGKRSFASVQLQDGRLLRVPVLVKPPRPQVKLLSKGVQDEVSATPSPVHLGSPDDLPVDGRLVFFLRAREPEDFSRDEQVEVAAADGSFRTVLALADGSLMLEDAKTVLGVVAPLVRFGSSAYGPLRTRVLAADGAAGDWLTLGTLVRLPGFKELRCPHSATKPCTLTGTNLFLAASIAATTSFDNATDVPPEFTGTQLSVPHPANGVLYLKLRDDPATVQTLTLPVMPMTAPAAQAVPEPPQPAASPATPPLPEKAVP